jgi:hypothetical protein
MIGSVSAHAPQGAHSTKPSQSHRCVAAFAKKKAGKKGSSKKSKVSASGYALSPVILLQMHAISMHGSTSPILVTSGVTSGFVSDLSSSENMPGRTAAGQYSLEPSTQLFLLSFRIRRTAYHLAIGS